MEGNETRTGWRRRTNNNLKKRARLKDDTTDTRKENRDSRIKGVKGISSVWDDMETEEHLRYHRHVRAEEQEKNVFLNHGEHDGPVSKEGRKKKDEEDRTRRRRRGEVK